MVVIRRLSRSTGWPWQLLALLVVGVVVTGGCGGGGNSNSQQQAQPPSGQQAQLSSRPKVKPPSEPFTSIPKVKDPCRDVAEGREREAITKLNAVVKSTNDPQVLAPAQFCLGLAYLNLGELESAKASLRYAENNQSQLPADSRRELTALVFRGRMLIAAEQGDQEEGQRYLNMAAELAPDQRQALQQELNQAASTPTSASTEPQSTESPPSS
jgi:tetratricopeptide (TPR) repeat protein